MKTAITILGLIVGIVLGEQLFSVAFYAPGVDIQAIDPLAEPGLLAVCAVAALVGMVLLLRAPSVIATLVGGALVGAAFAPFLPVADFIDQLKNVVAG